MTKLVFEQMPTTVPDMRTWGAARDNLTFVIAVDDKFDGHITASVKVRGASPFDGGRHDLGTFDSFLGAIKACEEFRLS